MTEKVQKLTRKQLNNMLRHGVRYYDLVLINPGEGVYREEEFDSQYLREVGMELFPGATNIVILLKDDPDPRIGKVLVISLTMMVASVTFFNTFNAAVDELLGRKA